MHSPYDEDRPEGDCPHLLEKLHWPSPLSRLVKPQNPKNYTVVEIKDSLLGPQPTDHSVPLAPLLITISSKREQCLIDAEPERFLIVKRRVKNYLILQQRLSLLLIISHLKEIGVIKNHYNVKQLNNIL